MKKELFTGLACLFLLLACSAEEVTPEDQNDGTFKEVQIVTADVITTPCEFDFNTIQEGDTLNIACSHDLDGANVFIPANVVINYYEGGKIFNGSLLFEGNGKIDGRLLNYQLGVDGKATLLSTTYLFEKENWNITEGEVSDDEALDNKENLQSAINIAKKLGADTFKINTLDAYMNIESEYGNMSKAIYLPSNFHLRMSDKTYLRVQPNNKPSGALFFINKNENLTIQGGVLIGDRFQHDYSPYNDWHGIPRDTHEWQALFHIAGSENIQLDNIVIKEATGDCIWFASVPAEGGRSNPSVKWNKDIIIKNCSIKKARRNNISICDGENIIIENNQILDCGLGEIVLDNNGKQIYSSCGVAPRYGIDIEPVYYYGSFSYESINKHENVENVTIKKNTFKGNYAGSVMVYSGDNVTIDGNFSDNSIDQNNTSGSKITNNILVAREGLNSKAAITTADYRMYTDYIKGNLKQYALENDVTGNSIEGFSTGLKIRGGGSEIYNNTIKECDTGLIIMNLESADISNNHYTSTTKGSRGIILGGYANNVKIYHETYDVDAAFIYTNGFNKMNPNMTNDVTAYNIEIYECSYTGNKVSTIRKSTGIELRKNNLNTGLEIWDSERITFNGNILNMSNFYAHGIILGNSSTSSIINNTISTHESFEDIIVQNEPANANNIINGNK